MPVIQPSSTAISQRDNMTPTTTLAPTTTTATTVPTICLSQAGYIESIHAPQYLLIAAIGFGIGYSFAVLILCACYARRLRQGHAERVQVQTLPLAQIRDHDHCLHCLCAAGPSGLGIPVELNSSSFATRSRSTEIGAAGSMTIIAATAAFASSGIVAGELGRRTIRPPRESRCNSSSRSGSDDDDETSLTSKPPFGNGAYDGFRSSRSCHIGGNVSQDGSGGADSGQNRNENAEMMQANNGGSDEGVFPGTHSNTGQTLEMLRELRRDRQVPMITIAVRRPLSTLGFGSGCGSGPRPDSGSKAQDVDPHVILTYRRKDTTLSKTTSNLASKIDVSPSKTSNGPHHGMPRLTSPQTQQETTRPISSTASDIAFWYDIARRYANSYDAPGSETAVQNTPQTHSATYSSAIASYTPPKGTTKTVDDDRGDDDSIVDPPLHDAASSKKNRGTSAGSLDLRGEEIVVYLSSEPHIMPSTSNCGVAPADVVTSNYQTVSPPIHSTEIHSSESAVSMETDMDLDTNTAIERLSRPSSTLSLTTRLIDRESTFGQPLSQLENYTLCKDADAQSLTRASSSLSSRTEGLMELQK
ncbi:hypothetical protein EDD21DRAFT_416854 [Dissophora ornata]|nr:hypothetical protein EDD21DRAFT_416854 [Dissophora ornata]